MVGEHRLIRYEIRNKTIGVFTSHSASWLAVTVPWAMQTDSCTQANGEKEKQKIKALGRKRMLIMWECGTYNRT